MSTFMTESTCEAAAVFQTADAMHRPMIVTAFQNGVAGVTAALRDAGVVRGWRGELYPALSSFGQPPLCLIERAAAPHFGIKARAVGSFKTTLVCRMRLCGEAATLYPHTGANTAGSVVRYLWG